MWPSLHSLEETTTAVAVIRAVSVIPGRPPYTVAGSGNWIITNSAKAAEVPAHQPRPCDCLFLRPMSVIILRDRTATAVYAITPCVSQALASWENVISRLPCTCHEVASCVFEATELPRYKTLEHRGTGVRLGVRTRAYLSPTVQDTVFLFKEAVRTNDGAFLAIRSG